MKSHSSFDRETFQQMLANAYAVQESRINTQSLSDIMQVQRSVANGKLDLEGAMKHIVESARNVASAAGAAIALFDGDHLTYRAGSGSAGGCIGLQVTASLTVSAQPRSPREILRVENAQTDKRIEADICRQFGANSLLMMPIYLDGMVAGVLDIRFREAHTFQEGEVRTYRLMAEQIEAALMHPAQSEQKENLAPEPPSVPETSDPLTFEPITPYSETALHEGTALPDDDFAEAPGFFMLPENEHSLYARCRAVLSDIMRLPGFRHTAWFASSLAQRANNFTWQNGWSTAVRTELSSVSKRSALLAMALARRARNVRWHAVKWHAGRRQWSASARGELSSFSKRSTLLALRAGQRAKQIAWSGERRGLALATVAFALVLTAFVAYTSRGPAASLEPSTQSNSVAAEGRSQIPKPLPGKSAILVSPSAASAKGTTHARTALRRVRVGQNEVDYVADDVTMRVFTTKPAPKHPRPANGRVARFGDDVTVRYFTPPASPTRTASR